MPDPIMPRLNELAADDEYGYVRHALLWIAAGDDPDGLDADLTAGGMGDEDLPAPAVRAEIRLLLARLVVTAAHRDALSDLLLSYSLCPVHVVDYAICFDDGNPDCSQVRACFPGHDS